MGSVNRIAWVGLLAATIWLGPGCEEGGNDRDLKYCVDVINSYRAQVGRPALSRSSALEDCAGDGARYDAGESSPHAHFVATSGCSYTADAENEIPGWPLDNFGSVREIIDQGTAMMWAEGPGGGHYENIIGDHTHVGCGIYVTSDNQVWIVQDFK